MGGAVGGAAAAATGVPKVPKREEAPIAGGTFGVAPNKPEGAAHAGAPNRLDAPVVDGTSAEPIREAAKHSQGRGG